MQESVKQDRWKAIGGSDTPIILEISPFKKRFDLLLEKAQVVTPKEFTSPQIEYGNVMEEKIRNHINKTRKKKFVETKIEKVIDDVPYRYHSDGFSGNCVLEVKTTSQTYDNIVGYKKYVVQLLLGMYLNEVNEGLLAVYHRPSDYSYEFDPTRLQTFKVKMKDYQELMEQILNECKKFWLQDLPRVKDNPFITESELRPQLPSNVEKQMLAIELLEEQLKDYKELQEKFDESKEVLYEEMFNYSIKDWTLPSGTKFTLVLPTQETHKLVEKFDEDKFKEENPDLYQKYLVKEDKTTKGRKGYLKINVK